MAGLILITILALATILAPVLANYSYDTINLDVMNEPPSAEHWLGTDNLGRDIFSRLLYGGRVSLMVGLAAVSIYLSVGVTLGSIAGYYGGFVDSLIMRFTDIIMVIPFLPLALTMAQVLTPGVTTTILVLGILGWTGLCRLVRGEFLSLRKRDYVEAAISEGAGDFRIIFHHILPNAMAPIVVAATLGVAGAIIGEAALSFLGLGVVQPFPSWGNMLEAGMETAPRQLYGWQWIPPGVLIFIAVLAVNLVGDGLRDALDPRLRN
jgi:peptide/nickel transport system permease protein